MRGSNQSLVLLPPLLYTSRPTPQSPSIPYTTTLSIAPLSQRGFFVFVRPLSLFFSDARMHFGGMCGGRGIEDEGGMPIMENPRGGAGGRKRGIPNPLEGGRPPAPVWRRTKGISINTRACYTIHGIPQHSSSAAAHSLPLNEYVVRPPRGISGPQSGGWAGGWEGVCGRVV